MITNNGSIGQEVMVKMAELINSPENVKLFRKVAKCSCQGDKVCDLCRKSTEKEEIELDKAEAPHPIEEVSRLLVEASEILENEGMHDFSASILETLDSFLLSTSSKDKDKDKDKDKEDKNEENKEDSNEVRILDEFLPEEELSGLEDDPELELLDRLKDDHELLSKLNEIGLSQRMNEQLKDLDVDQYAYPTDINDIRRDEIDIESDPELAGWYSEKTRDSHRELMDLLDKIETLNLPLLETEWVGYPTDLRPGDASELFPHEPTALLPEAHEHRETLHSALEEPAVPPRAGLLPGSLAAADLEWLSKYAEEEEENEDEEDFEDEDE